MTVGFGHKAASIYSWFLLANNYTDDEDMYDDGYPDEMEYDEDMSQDDEENVSDDDDEIDGMGHVEGLPGDAGVVEVIMGDDDDDDESMDDDEEDTSDEDDEDDEMDSGDIEELEEVVEEIVNGEGSPVEDDGASEWESESENDDEDDDEQDEIDYEGGAQDIDEARLHGLEPGQLSLENYRDVVRAAMGTDFIDDFPAIDDRFGEEDEADDGKNSPATLQSVHGHDVSLLTWICIDDEDEEDDIDEDVFVYDHGNMGEYTHLLKIGLPS